MTRRPSALVYLPANDALPGVAACHSRYLSTTLPGIDWRFPRDEDEFLRELPEADIAVVYRFRAAWLGRAKRLTLLATPAAGREWVEVRSKPGLTVQFGEFHGELIGETVLGMMLAFARGIKTSLDRQRDDPWDRQSIANSMFQLRGGTATILGFGHIGKWIGRYLKCMGLTVRGVNRSDLSRPEYFADGDGVYGLDDLDALLPDTDHLILALPGEASSRQMLDARRLALLPPTAHVYNIGRGNAIDETALVAALHSGAIAGAGLDVYEQEPLAAGAAIRSCPNVILMPHVSAFGDGYMDIYVRELTDKVEGLFPGTR